MEKPSKVIRRWSTRSRDDSSGSGGSIQKTGSGVGGASSSHGHGNGRSGGVVVNKEQRFSIVMPCE